MLVPILSVSERFVELMKDYLERSTLQFS
jgi:hypothetical protein